MMCSRSAFGIVAGAALMFSAAGTAAAADGSYLGFAPVAWGYGGGGHYVGEAVPYYALHPPVYYSYVRARPYGLSPYAWPPVVTPPKPPAQPLVLKNPYVPAATGASRGPGRTALAPLRIVNPFVTPGASEGEPKRGLAGGPNVR